MSKQNELEAKERKELIENELVADWLIDLSKGTRRVYVTYFYKFLKQHKMTPEQLLEQARDNDKGLLKKKLNKWYNYVRDDLKKSKNTARGIENCLKSFCSYHGSPVKTKQRSNAREIIRKELRKDHVRQLVDHTRSLRERVLIVLAFQSGMSISDLIDLNYDDVKDAIKNDISPFIIRYVREKTETEAAAVIGRDSVDLLKEYIECRERLGEEINLETALFLGEKNGERLHPAVTQRKIKRAAIEAGLIAPDEVKKYQSFNPVGFHALRSGFSSIAKNKGLPEDQIELALGHKAKYNGAYSRFTSEELIRNYAAIEEDLSIFAEVEKVDFEQEISVRDDKIDKLEGIVGTLSEELSEMKKLYLKVMEKLGID